MSALLKVLIAPNIILRVDQSVDAHVTRLRPLPPHTQGGGVWSIAPCVLKKNDGRAELGRAELGLL